jgi:hypothetical protein
MLSLAAAAHIHDGWSETRAAAGGAGSSLIRYTLGFLLVPPPLLTLAVVRPPLITLLVLVIVLAMILGAAALAALVGAVALVTKARPADAEDHSTPGADAPDELDQVQCPPSPEESEWTTGPERGTLSR